MDQKAPLSSFIIGADTLLTECGETWMELGHQLLGVITTVPKIAKWARERNIRVIDAAGDYKAALAEQPFDFLFAITHLAIIPDDVLLLPKKGAINFHDGPLPRYAGLNTPAWALINEESGYGISWHTITPGIDEGDLLEQRLFEIQPGETSLSLNTRNFAAAMDSFRDLTVALAAGTSAPRKQDATQRSYFGRHQRPEACCVLDFEQPATRLEALIRALDFGRYPNALGLAKLRLGEQLYAAVKAEAREDQEGQPGTVLQHSEAELVIGTTAGALAITELWDLAGVPVPLSALSGRVKAGDAVATAAPVRERLSAQSETLARAEAFWAKRLTRLEPVEVPYVVASEQPAQTAHFAFSLPADFAGRFAAEHLAAATITGFLAHLARLGAKDAFDVAFRDEFLARELAEIAPFLARHLPLHAELDPEQSFEQARAKVTEELKVQQKRRTYLLDLIGRNPELHAHPELRAGRLLPVGIQLGGRLDSAQLGLGQALSLVIGDDGRAQGFLYDQNRITEDKVRALAHQLEALYHAAASDAQKPIKALDLLDPTEKQKVLYDWNRTAADYARDACVHQLFEAQVERTPDATAVVFEGQSLSYRALNERANQLAVHLVERGIGPGKLVGICVDRSLELVVSVLGTHKAGGAYVPLDPAYPKERIAFMIMDAEVQVLLTEERLVADLPMHSAEVVCVDSEWKDIGQHPKENRRSAATPADLAYVIYTSGSTGKPKGVQVEHRNVSNFFTGMDQRLPSQVRSDGPGTWLAVTSLSFDISVLELSYTLSRGFKVVVHLDRARTGQGGSQVSSRGMGFGLFMWGNDDGPGRAKYELMLKGAKFFDQHGFESVWTPERHFAAFGGPYPNPSVTGAAIAAITERIQVRAGSVVSPLHHAIRLTEEWSVVDNLSNGRVGLAFAAGWHPNDFVLRPENHKNNKAVMFEQIDVVRRLWRGESVTFQNPLGDPFAVHTLPRPVQKELPFWVTTAGNPDTYRQAGRVGANLLTHLLGQSLEEVAGKIAAYREARKEAGFDPATGIVTLMLHTFVGEDTQEVKRTVRQPMKDYLRSSVNLVQNFAWAFPAFKRPNGAAKPADIDLGSLSEEELDAILDHAFERYFETSGLFGTVEECVSIVEGLKGIDVDEVACLLDFGVPTQTVLNSLPLLAEVRATANQKSKDGSDYSLPGQIRQHAVTHLQCTPSMARMILGHDESRAALQQVSHLMIGGEAFPPELAKELHAVLNKPGATITNMYGPTETTIWSTTQAVDGAGGAIPIGKPIANTQVYVLDRHRQPVPVGVPGELYIAGAGVVRGYLRRPELTTERFLPDPFVGGEHRMYRTGDLVKWREDGVVEFLGRTDHQVKIRGYRIELGEIEALLARHRGVKECVVVVREDTPGDQRMVAYYVPKQKALEANDLKADLRGKLPEYMVPSLYLALEAMPLTPNGKIDRKQLPSPEALLGRSTTVEYVAPTNDIEAKIAKLWQETLGKDQVGVEDNFFDIGGHSLLVVKVHRQLKELVTQPIQLTDLYRFPTIRALTDYLNSDGASEGLKESADRAQKRKELLAKRRQRPRPS